MRKIMLTQIASYVATVFLLCSSGMAQQTLPWDEDVDAPNMHHVNIQTTPEPEITPIVKASADSTTKKPKASAISKPPTIQSAAINTSKAIEPTKQNLNSQAIPISPTQTANPLITGPSQKLFVSPSSIATKTKKPKVATDSTTSSAPSSLEQQAALYSRHFSEWQSNPKHTSMEPVLNEGQALAAKILKAIDDTVGPSSNTSSNANTLDKATFEALTKEMPGYLLIWHKVIVVAPDPAYWLEAAKKHGLPVDIAFFNAMNQTLNGYWPITMEQITDLSGCTRFGHDDLVRLYGIWKIFQDHYPHAYLKALQDPNLPLLTDIEDQLLHGQAACDGPNEVLQELQLFVTAYPHDSLTPQIKLRLANLEKNPNAMTYYKGINAHQPTDAK